MKSIVQSFSLLQLIIALTRLADSHRLNHHHHNPRELEGDHGHDLRCATREGNEADTLAQERAYELTRFKMGRMDDSYIAYLNGPRVIPVCFHNPQRLDGFFGFVGSFTSPNYLDDSELQRQLDHLNQAFSSKSCCDPWKSWCNRGDCSPAGDTNIQFVMAKLDEDGNINGVTSKATDKDACITRPQGDEWMSMDFGQASEFDIKSALRKGDASVLNIFFMKARKDGDNLLGFATFPWDYAAKPELDGVVIDPKTVAGAGNFFNPYEGDTLVHELGHWLGLHHTFQGGCEMDGAKGDAIADTAPQAFPTYGCDHPREYADLCTFDDRPPPIHNYMGYNSDPCLFEWTPGQVDKMRTNYDVYRASERSIAGPPVALNSTNPTSEPFTLLVQDVLIVTFEGDFDEHGFSCYTNADNGDVDLFLNWDGSLTDFGCSSETPTSIESCVIATDGNITSPQLGYALVYASSTTTDVTITCTSVPPLWAVVTGKAYFP